MEDLRIGETMTTEEEVATKETVAASPEGADTAIETEEEVSKIIEVVEVSEVAEAATITVVDMAVEVMTTAVVTVEVTEVDTKIVTTAPAGAEVVIEMVVAEVETATNQEATEVTEEDIEVTLVTPNEG